MNFHRGVRKEKAGNQTCFSFVSALRYIFCRAGVQKIEQIAGAPVRVVFRCNIFVLLDLWK